MDYVLGAGLMFAAVLTIALGRLALGRPGTGADPGADPGADREAFGAGEALAFVFTGLLAAGISLMAMRAFADPSPASLAQMLAALAAAGAASALA